MGLSGRVLAPWLAGLVGLAAGVGVAFAVAEDDGSEDPRPGQDPLGLGVDLVNLDCTGEKLLLIGWGDAAAALDSAIAANRDSDPLYLRTSESCDTVYGRETGPVPDYAAYLGPFDSFRDVCELRMTAQHRGDQVTVLRSGNVQNVRCACHLDAATFPVLSPGMEVNAENSSWVRVLQQLLVDVDAELFPQKNITGFYDEPTQARVRELQDHVGATGIVDELTWETILAQVCNDYTY